MKEELEKMYLRYLQKGGDLDFETWFKILQVIR